MNIGIVKKGLLTMVLLAQGWQYGAVNQTLFLDEALRRMEIAPQGYVVSGWLRLNNERSVYILERLLKNKISLGDNVLDFYGEKLKIVLSGEREKMLSMQMVTEDVYLAEECRKFWQVFADTWGKGELIGITVMARAYEEINPFAQSELCRDLALYLKGEGDIHVGDSGVEGIYYSKYLAREMTICQAKINYNVVLRQKEGYTDIYLGYPVIYQTY